MTIRVISSILLGAATLTLGACGRDADMAGGKNSASPASPAPVPATATVAGGERFGVVNATLRLSTSAQSPSAAYFTINGGPTGGVLTDVTSPDAASAEIHESRMDGEMMSMAAVPSITVAANQSVSARPGGLHLMLFDLSPSARRAGKVRLTFNFADGRRVQVETLGLQPAAAEAGPAPNGTHQNAPENNAITHSGPLHSNDMQSGPEHKNR